MFHLDRKKSVLFFVIIVFLLSFLWQLFLIYGIGFFWESLDIFHPYWEKSFVLQQLGDKYNVSHPTILPVRISIGLNIAKEFVKKYFVVNRLFQIGFDSYSVVDRPYQFFIWDLMMLCFGPQLIGYNIFTALIFAMVCTLIFYVISRLSILFALLGTVIFATSSEIWLTAVYKGQYGLFSLCNTFLAVLIFIKLTEKKNLNYLTACFYYFFIITASNFTSLIIGDGRYLAIIFFVTLLIFQREKLRFHLPMLIILFMMEFPVLGYVKKLFFDHSFSPINFSTHIGTNKSALMSLKIALSNYKFVRNALGSFLIVILYITLTINIAYLFFRKRISLFKQRLFPDIRIRRRTFLFVLWFISTLVMSARARSFAYDGSFSFQLCDLIYFILPFFLFLFYYLLSIINSLQKPFNIIILVACFCLIGTQIVHSSVRINKFREDWGSYLCAWQNAGKYIDNNSNHALALAFMQNHYSPFFLKNLNNKILATTSGCQQSQFCDINFIGNKFKEGFTEVFVIAEEKLDFRNVSDKMILDKVIPIDGNCGDLYDYLKIKFGHPSKILLYLYHFKSEEKS